MPDALATMTLLAGAVLVAMAFVERPVRRLPLSAALIYLAVGWLAAALSGVLAGVRVEQHAPALRVIVEWAVLVSLFAVGLRIPLPVATRAWRVAILLASIGMTVTIALAAALAHWLLALAWPAAALLASILAPTDPVLASEVRIRSETDRDAVRLALSAEGGLNDGTAFPAVMLALGWLGLHELGEHGAHWLLRDLLWSIGGGMLVGWLLGRAVGAGVTALLRRGHPFGWDELLFVGVIALGYGVAQWLEVSAFLVVFLSGIALFRGQRAGDPGLARACLASQRLARPVLHAEAAPGARDVGDDADELPRRMQAFGTRLERLVEMAMVLLLGAAMTLVQWDWRLVAFALALLLVARPLAAAAVMRRDTLPAAQRRLIGWFGIRGVGSLFYLSFALEAGLNGDTARTVVSACLVAIAASILLHGVSATPLMARYHARRPERAPR